MDHYELTRPAAALPVPPPREPHLGEEAALTAVAAAGRRAADWLRSLPGPEDDNWIGGDLADAVQEATGSLDPGDCDDAERWGNGGVSEALRDRLDVAWSLTHVGWVSPGHKAVVLAVAGAVLGMPKALANDPAQLCRRNSRRCARSSTAPYS